MLGQFLWYSMAKRLSLIMWYSMSQITLSQLKFWLGISYKECISNYYHTHLFIEYKSMNQYMFDVGSSFSLKISISSKKYNA